MSTSETELFEPDMPRIFEAVYASLDPEDVPSLVMSALQLRKLTCEDPDENPEVIRHMGEYDRVWDELSSAGVDEPDSSDWRQALETCDMFGTDTILSPWAIFRPRHEYLAFLKKRREDDQKRFTNNILNMFDRLSPNNNRSTADFLLGLAGTRLENGRIEMDDLDDHQAERIKEVIAPLSPVMRDIIRISPGIYGEALDNAVTGTEIEDPALRSAYRQIRRDCSE